MNVSEEMKINPLKFKQCYLGLKAATITSSFQIKKQDFVKISISQLLPKVRLSRVKQRVLSADDKEKGKQYHNVWYNHCNVCRQGTQSTGIFDIAMFFFLALPEVSGMKGNECIYSLARLLGKATDISSHPHSIAQHHLFRLC